MNWHNLKTFTCPHCAAPLEKGDEGMIYCSRCSFTINRTRFESILQHRKQGPTAIVKMLWQNLHDHRCPMCENYLHQPARSFMLKCLTATCSFRISPDRLAEATKDPGHPANKYRGIHSEEDERRRLKNL